jgi:hypothetical protein
VVFSGPGKGPGKDVSIHLHRCAADPCRLYGIYLLANPGGPGWAARCESEALTSLPSPSGFNDLLSYPAKVALGFTHQPIPVATGGPVKKENSWQAWGLGTGSFC